MTRPETVVLAVLVFAVLWSAIPHARQRARRRHTRFYDWYMHSRLWNARRWVWYWTSNRRCEKCHHRVVLHRHGIRYRMGTPVVTVHHKTYQRLGRERRSDVSLLCWPCHSRQDAWRHQR